MKIHPLHPASPVLEMVKENGWHIEKILAFTRSNTLLQVRSTSSQEDFSVLKIFFGYHDVLDLLDPDIRPASYGFFWYSEMSELERKYLQEARNREIAVTQQLSKHPCWISVYEVGSLSTHSFLRMEYIPDGSFRKLLWNMHDSIDNNKIQHALSILSDVAVGISYLHELGYVHRDIYQENILIAGNHGTITDLGCVRPIGELVGPLYRGPEVHWAPEYLVAYNNAEPSSDVFSFGVLLHRIYTGDIPRFGMIPEQRIRSDNLKQLISVCLESDPKNRPTMIDVSKSLSHILEGQLWSINN